VTRRVLVLAAVLALAARGGAQPLDAGLERYRAAAAAGAVTTVSGRAVEDARRPGEPGVPVSGVAVTLLPRSEALLARFEAIRRAMRADLAAYRTSAAALRQARRAYERALSDAGAGELVRYTATAPDGTFELDGVPAGPWLLVAERAVHVDKRSPEPKGRGQERFARTPRLRGYYAVTVWVLEVDAGAGAAEPVELNERNAWVTAIEEERVPDDG